MIRSICLLIALVGGGLFQVSAAPDEVVFRSDVSLVRIDAQVVNRDNRTITDLRAEDFVLREDGRPQQIRSFGTVNMPVDVVLLLDVSASMRPHVERIASAAHQALRVLGDQDRVAIMVFDRSTRLRLPFRKGQGDVERELESLLNQETFNGGTDITRALLDAANYVAREGRTNARRAIVILTDDQTERNRDVEGVSRALTRADAVLSLLLAPDAMANRSPGMGRGRRGGGGYPGGGYPGGGGGGGYPGGGGGPLGGPLGGIILGRRGGPYGGRGGGGGGGGPVMIGSHTQSAGTAEIARRSGGDTMPVDDASALETTLARIRQRYALYFYLPQDVKAGDERGIEVQLADASRRRYPDAEVRYRRVYLAPGGPAGGAANPPEPTEVYRAPVDARDQNSQSNEPSPRLRRRPAVDQDGSRQGPLTDSTASQGGWRRAEDRDNRDARDNRESQPAGSSASPPQSATAPATPAAPADKDPACGGWRKVDEPMRPACPSDTATTGQQPRKTDPPKSKPGEQH